jgi:hypothetical protein
MYVVIEKRLWILVYTSPAVNHFSFISSTFGLDWLTFGQFKFFWAFEKKMLRSMVGFPL